MSFFEYITTDYMQILTLIIEHMKLTAISVGLAVLIGVPHLVFLFLMRLKLVNLFYL